MCIVCSVFVYAVSSAICCAGSVPNGLDGRQQSRKAVGGTAPDDKHAYPCLCDNADVALHSYHTAKHILKRTKHNVGQAQPSQYGNVSKYSHQVILSLRHIFLWYHSTRTGSSFLCVSSHQARHARTRLPLFQSSLWASLRMIHNAH